jgi:hypothetical protein
MRFVLGILLRIKGLVGDIELEKMEPDPKDSFEVSFE